MRFRGLLPCVGLLLLAGCAGQNPVGESTVRVDEVTKAGFLEDYSILKKGEEGEASLVYWNPTADLAAYDKIMVDPVTVWLGPESDFKEVSPKERQQLANEFHAAIVKALAEDFKIVDQSGPGTMRVRMALTDAEESSPTLDTISTYIPQIRLLQSVSTVGSDTAGFVGEASAEAELRDAETGLLLAAAMDRRAGTKALGSSSFDSWDDARKVFEAWAKQMVANLKKRRGE